MVLVEVSVFCVDFLNFIFDSILCVFFGGMYVSSILLMVVLCSGLCWLMCDCMCKL